MYLKTFVAVWFALACAACTHTFSNKSHPRSSAYAAQTLHYGEVRDIRETEIDGKSSNIGTWGGGLIGWSLGRTIGSGSGSRVAGAVGGVAGAIGGAAAEKEITTQAAYEITVELEDGRELLVVQPADIEFTLGERVRVLTMGNGAARISKL